MTPWLILPVKSLRNGKSRLARHLSHEQRSALNQELLARSLHLAQRYPGLHRTLVVSRCPDVLAIARAHGARIVKERGEPSLNNAVEQATHALPAGRRPEILVLSCDLPIACDADLQEVVRRSRKARCVVIATDRRGAGTNALCLPPGAVIRFRYGPASRRHHVREAARRRLRCRVVRPASLAFDLDTIADYHAFLSTVRSDR